MPNTISRKLVGLALRDPAAPPPQEPAKRGPPHRITPKLQAAINAMVWQGLKREDAARAAGLAPHSLYKAFERPHVKAAYLAALEVLRTSALSRNFHILEDIAENADNSMAKVAAIRQMGKVDDAQSIRHAIGMQTPGLTIQIVSDSAPAPVTIENDGG